MKRISKILLLITFIIFSGTIYVNAAFSAGSEQTVNSGESISITVTSTENVDSYNIDLSSYGDLTYVECSKNKDNPDEDMVSVNSEKGSIGYMTTSEGTKTLGIFKFKAPEVSEDKTCKVVFNINKGETTVTATITVKAPEKEPEEQAPTEPEDNNTSSENNTTTQEPQTPTVTEPEPEPTKSSDATLKMLGLGASAKNPSQYDFSGFKSSKTSYDVTVPYEVTSLEVYYTINDSKATCTVSGNDSFDVGKNAIKVTVTAEDGTQKTYTINVTREEEQKLSGDATLSNLGIGKSASEPSEYDFTGFTKSGYEYSITVPYEVTSLDVYYTVTKSTSIADVSGSSDFKVGDNAIKILVTAEDGTQKTYTINVTRLAQNTVITTPEENEQNPSQEPEENGLQLEKLEISKGKLSPEFKGSVTDYSVTVGSSVERIDITAVANDENATVEIAGNEGLKEGKNVITILVRSADDSEIITYQINVTKNSGFDIAGFFSNRENQNIMIILGIILILIIIIIVILVRDGKNDDDDEEVKVKPKKAKAKRYKDDSENVEINNEAENSDDTENVNKE